MHADDRKAFDTILAEIFGAIDKPLGEATREAFWKGLERMSIVEFSRCRDLLFEDLQRDEAPRKFGVPNIWALKGRLRAPGPTKRFGDDWHGDRWDGLANMRLLGYVLRKGQQHRYFDAEQTEILVSFKNSWANLMRSAGEPEDVPLADQDAAWLQGICMAEVELVRVKAA